MRKALALLWAAVQIFTLSACRAESTAEAAIRHARDVLAHAGYQVSEQAYQAAVEQYLYMEQLWQDYSFSDSSVDPEECIYMLLMSEGFGQYDYDTLTWSPTSDWIYVFDAEVFNVSGMYTEFFQGVQSIIPDATFTDIEEDLSGMTREWDPDSFSDGTRHVSFRCNGHLYETELDSYGDWINMDILGLVNRALKKAGASGQLHCISEDYDQMIFLFYGSAEEASALRRLMGTSDPQSQSPAELLEWLGELIFN